MIKILLAAALTAASSAALAQTAPATPSSAAHDTAAHSALPTINSTIKDLLANPTTAAIVDKHLPGVAQHPALPQFQDMTLGQVAPLSGGVVTPAIIEAIDTDLKALPAT